MGSRDKEHEAWNLGHGLKPNEHLPLVCPRCEQPHVETLTNDPSQPDYHHHVRQCTYCGLRFDLFVRSRSAHTNVVKICPCHTQVEEPGPHIPECPFSDGAYEPGVTPTQYVDWGRRRGRDEMRRAVISWLADNARKLSRRLVPVAHRRALVNDMFREIDGREWP